MRKKIFQVLLTVILLSLLCITLYTTSVLAYENDNLTSLYFYGDTIYNYDFTNPDKIGEDDAYKYVDHPATIIFAGDADKTTVKNGFTDDGFVYTGNTIYNELNDGAGWDADTDGGKKTDNTDVMGSHYRLYAADGTDMYNATWGYWVLATTHEDILPYRGWAEDVEVYVAYLAEEDNGWDVYEDEYYFYNYDDEYWSGVCCYDCNGWATFIDVP